MKKTKRFLAWLLTLALLTGVMPGSLFADEIDEIGQADAVLAESFVPEEFPSDDGDQPDGLYSDSLEPDTFQDDAWLDFQGDGSGEDAQPDESGQEDYFQDGSDWYDTPADVSDETADYWSDETEENREDFPPAEDPNEIIADAEKYIWEGPDVSFITAEGEIAEALEAQEGTTAVLDGDAIVIHYVPYDDTAYAGFSFGAVTDYAYEDDTWVPEPEFEANEDGTIDIVLGIEYSGYAHPVTVIKNIFSDGSWTEDTQYYLAVPGVQFLAAYAADENDLIIPEEDDGDAVRTAAAVRKAEEESADAGEDTPVSGDAGGGTGNIVVSFEYYDAAENQVVLLCEPVKVAFTAEDTGKSIAESLLGTDNVNMPNGWMQSFTIDGIEYTNTTMDANGSWLVYRNNIQDSTGPAEYKPVDGDVYRFVLTTYDTVTFEMPAFQNDMSALYWAYAETGQDKTEANTLIQSKDPSQADIDAMTAALSGAEGAHYVIIDGTTVQVNTTTYPYTYFTTLTADKSAAEAGETVTVTVTVPEGMALVEGSLKANGSALTKVTDTTYTFVMPNAHVTVTARFETLDTGKLLTAVFSDDDAGLSVIPLDPEFDKDTFEYELSTYDYIVEENDDEIYFTGTFDESASAKWQYYMTYSGYGFYSEGPEAKSGEIQGHSSSNMLYPGMTNGMKHRLDVTSAGGTVTTYFFTTTMLPTLESISIDGEEVEFEGNEAEITAEATIEKGASTISLLAEPYNEDYYVYLGTGTDDIAGEAADVPVVPGENVFTLVVDDDNDVTNTYTLTVTVKVENPAADALKELIEEAKALDESITEGTEAGQYAEGTKAALETAIAEAETAAGKDDLTEEEAEAAMLALQAAIKAAKDAQNPEEFTVYVIANYEPDKLGYVNRELLVSSKDAAEAGYEKPEEYSNKVTALDVLADVHKELYADFADDPSAYLSVANGWIMKAFGVESIGLSYYVNDAEVSTLCHETVLTAGDKLSVFTLDSSWLSRYLTFEEETVTAEAGKAFDLVLKGNLTWAMDGNTDLNLEGYTVSVFEKDSAAADAVAEAVTDADGKAAITIAEAGSYYATVTAARNDESEQTAAFSAPYAEITVKDNSVPEELQLSFLEFRSGLMTNASSYAYEMEPAYDPGQKEYTVYVPDFTANVYTYASLAEGINNDITLKYASISSGAATEKKIDQTTGYVSASGLISSNKTAGNDMQIFVGESEAYLIHIVRTATLASGTAYGLNIQPQGSESLLEMEPAYDRSVYEYDAYMAADGKLDVKVRATARTESVLSVDGSETPEDTAVTVIPAWQDRNADLKIEVSAPGARSGEYVIHLHEQAASIEITKAPDKTEYEVGETFDPAGIEVTATYADGTSAILEAKDISFTPDGPLTAEVEAVTISAAGLTAEQKITVLSELKGSGTLEDPFQIETAEDMDKLDRYTEAGMTFEGKYLKVLADITLNEGWNGVGDAAVSGPRAKPGADSRPFMGDFNGDGHTITIPEGGKAVFSFMKSAVVHDLAIFGSRIEDNALLSWYVQTSSGITIDNVTIKSGTQTLESGFLGGYASGSDTVTIKNSTIEDNVIIGYDRQQSNIGAFAGELNGTIDNCSSAATVYGVDYVGGIAANKGQSMGTFAVTNCTFTGTVEASGSYVGGIAGAGYGGTGFGMSSAFSAPGVTIENCASEGSVSGKQGVGGIFGGEGAQAQAWDNGPTTIRNNSFTGQVSGESYVGGTIGYILSLNKNSFIENNYYASGCGAASGIGAVGGIDTSGHESGTIDGVYYFNTSTAEGRTLAEIQSEVAGHAVENYIEAPNSNSKTIGSAGYSRQIKGDHNRTDDPLGADKDALCYTDTGTDLSQAVITFPEPVIYTGNALEPAMEVKLGDVLLEAETDYTAAYTDNTDVGMGSVTITGTGNYTGSAAASFRILFSDVADQTQFYFDYVYWAVDNGITTGFDNGTFRPLNGCNRAAVVTFLWRMAGKPEPQKMAAFKDMTGNEDFDKAISWAAEQGITTGWDDNTFRPWNTCNRAAIVTFLWRFAGKPEAGSAAAFKDMTGNEDFDKAISWAAEQGITTGWDDNTFRPWNTCNRLAVVSFLYRFDEKQQG